MQAELHETRDVLHTEIKRLAQENAALRGQMTDFVKESAMNNQRVINLFEQMALGFENMQKITGVKPDPELSKRLAAIKRDADFLVKVLAMPKEKTQSQDE